MNTNEYLSKILIAQTLAEGSAELKALQEHRADVEELLREHFSDCSPTIRYGGSKAKGTMIRESYDLDIICYFLTDDTNAGETLEKIYENVKAALAEKYFVDPKTSALRLKSKNGLTTGIDFHIDVVPGRFTDDTKSDAFIHQSNGDKERLKTNLDMHVKHVKDSGFTEAIRLLKLWKVHNGLSIRNFAFELVIIKLLKGKIASSLSAQLEHVWSEFRDAGANLSVEDPANPVGNNLSELLNNTVKTELSGAAQRSLNQIESSGWEAVFGPSEQKGNEEKKEVLRRAATAVVTPNRPWSA